MAELIYKAKGVCADEIRIRVANGIVEQVEFDGGCTGNAQGISRLVTGMPVEEVVRRLKGLDCDERGTSCPDQLAKALETIE